MDRRPENFSAEKRGIIMKKGLILGFIAGAAATAATALFLKKKHEEYCYYDEEEMNDDFGCDSCCGERCDCEDDCDCDDNCDCSDDCSCTDIPAEKADESVIVTDACVACGDSEDEALAAVKDETPENEI